MSFEGLQQALLSRGYEIVKVLPTAGQVQLWGRVPQAQHNNWLVVVHRFAFWPSTAWTSDISMHFIGRKTDRKLVYFWRCIFQCTDDLAPHYPEICRIITTAPRSSKIEVTSFMLPGANPNRYTGQHGARVGPAGKVLTGPDLIRRGR